MSQFDFMEHDDWRSREDEWDDQHPHLLEDFHPYAEPRYAHAGSPHRVDELRDEREAA